MHATWRLCYMLPHSVRLSETCSLEVMLSARRQLGEREDEVGAEVHLQAAQLTITQALAVRLDPLLQRGHGLVLCVAVCARPPCRSEAGPDTRIPRGRDHTGPAAEQILGMHKAAKYGVCTTNEGG